MIGGVTKSGFAYELEPEALDDYELLELLQQVDDGQTLAIMRVAPRLLGADQTAALKEHIRGENGRVSATAMIAAVMEILNTTPQGKNS